jgi:RNase H-like domain found in reverse transcriptase
MVRKSHPIAFASKRTSIAEAQYKLFMLEFAALKFALDKFNDIIWGFPGEIKTDCQALQNVLMSDTLNTTHARWCDGVLAHHIIDVCHIPGRVNLVGDGISWMDKGQPHRENDGSSRSVTPDQEHAQGIYHDLFMVAAVISTVHSLLSEHFINEAVFLQVLHALLGITGASTEAERRRAKHHSDCYFVEDGKLWRLGGATPTRAVTHWECVTKLEATQLAREEHAKVHMHRDHIRTQLLDKIYSPLLDASITTAILECRCCKDFGSTHIHALLAPITRRRPFELLVGDYLSMPMGKGGFTKIGLYADVFARKLWGFKSKSAAGKNTVDSLRKISQAFIAPETIMVDGGSHFNCAEVRDYCEGIGSKLHVVAAYAPWLSGLLEGSNRILLSALKRLCAPGLGEDDYESMALKDLPSNWPEYLDVTIKHLNNRILPSLKYSPNELLLGLVVNSRQTDSPEDIRPPTEQEVALHLTLVEQPTWTAMRRP